MNALLSYAWPGNVRELNNLIERAIILCEGRILQREHIMLDMPVGPQETTDDFTLADLERTHILRVLDRTRGAVGGPSGAARILGLNRTTLIARMKKLGITP
ncbi:MAG: hypothetical protein FJY97_16155 [candidate division Zixibacteria bacterium]|nr:hypothetical protein [candidate division Zixibacteria bacterium]